VCALEQKKNIQPPRGGRETIHGCSPRHVLTQCVVTYRRKERVQYQNKVEKNEPSRGRYENGDRDRGT